jgi:hypothetical protein
MKNCNSEFIDEVYRNASVALLSIKNVMDSVDNNGLRTEMRQEYDGYDNFIRELSSYMRDKGYQIKDVSKPKKMMMWSAIKMNTAFDDSKSHISEIMIKGTVMGITELTKILNDSSCVTDEKALDFAKRLLALEEEYEQNLKKFL